MSKGSRYEAIGNRTKAKVFGFALCAMVFALCVPAEAQQPKKVPRIGYLASADVATESARAEGILRALRERGYIEGQNIATQYRYAEGKSDRLPELAAELVRLNLAFARMRLGMIWCIGLHAAHNFVAAWLFLRAP